MKIELEVPADLFADVGNEAGVVRERLQLELALHLYASRKVSAGKASELAGIPRGSFENALKTSGIERNYSSADLEGDLAWASGGGTCRSLG